MFYKLIENKRDEWLKSEDCTVRDLLTYIAQRGFLRDAQFEAIKTYLYLKIACVNKPLWQLFTEGAFNGLDISQLELNESARGILSTNTAAVALLEYSRLKDKSGNQLAPGLETIEWLSVDCSAADKDAAWHSDTEIKIDRLGYVILNGTKTQDFWDGTIKCDQKPLRLKIRNICGDESTFVI